MAIQNPHDKFFKEIFSVRENALDFIQGILPSDIITKFDLTSLTLDQNNYVDERLDEYFSDLVYTCTFSSNRQLTIAFLFEHKSFPARYPHLQILRYMLNIWEAAIRNRKTPPLVIPIIVYHGKKRWKKEGMESYFRVEDRSFFGFIPAFDYLLTDLSKYTDAEIKAGVFQRVSLKIGLLIQKHIFDEEKLLKHLKDFMRLSILYNEEDRGLSFLEGVFRYIFSATEISVEEALRSTESVAEGVKEAAMTTAERLMKQGFKEGVEEGLEKGIAKGIEKGREEGTLLDKQNVLIRHISKKFGITEAEERLIKSVTGTIKLDRALDEILFAKSKKTVLDKVRE
ncbi:MAG: Rpn family recombination-promoting nuclease/putative transposase [Spirochaetota bacterium]